jgi:predicted phosphoribosyltransferase
MPTVRELSAPYENFMLGPRPGPGVCQTCFTFTEGYDRCYACGSTTPWADAVAPISYSVAGGQLHHTLAGYKRLSGPVAQQLGAQLAAVLWRYLDLHERCVAAAAGANAFELVAAVPSGCGERDEEHPLRRIVGEVVGPTRGRHERLLRRSGIPISGREFSPDKYLATRRLHGESVLLLDDTWTTGANAQSAAASLKGAGSGAVGVVVIGRHLKRDWRENERRLRALARPFDWDRCALDSSPWEWGHA